MDLQYTSIFIFINIATILGLIMFYASYLIATQKQDFEKASAYECGFSPFDESRSPFDIKFFLVSILFLIFDLEILFLFPWSLTLGQIGFLGFSTMMIFLIVLAVGFIYEWKKGGLDWD
jgi:NADH-quinone oxidoreductase subunit A